jgi:capsular polysaccharide biosynthesis protein
MKRYAASFFRHQWVYLGALAVLVLAAFGGTYVYVITRNDKYESHLRIWVGNTTQTQVNQALGPSTPAQDQAAQLDELLKSDTFMSAVVGDTSAGGQLAGTVERDAALLAAIRARVAVSADGSHTLTISYRDENAALTPQVVTAVANHFRSWELGVQDQRRAEIQQTLANAESTNPNRALGLIENLDPLVNQALQPEFQILDQASAAVRPAPNTRTALNLLGTGLAASFATVAAAVVLATWLDGTIRSTDDLVQLAPGVRILAVVPDLGPGEPRTEDRMQQVVRTPDSAAGAFGLQGARSVDATHR